MMSADRADGQMSSHFGKAEWILVADGENQAFAFVKNDALNGKGAVEIAIRQDFTDLIFTEIGNGAFGHLQAAGIRGWVAPAHLTGEQALLMLQRSELQPANASTKQGGSQACCCAGRNGSEASSCCSR
jgi:predicted Fe-Mo cluster-binding NifX family protein